nr:alpha/beta fold hydrolase [Stenotrophomonas chelatiphaga]
MYVEWEAPVAVTQPLPVVLVHGGTLQGTEWSETPDGRPGWAQRLVEAGYAVFVVDRPGHGRSPYHPDLMGPTSPPFSYERGRAVYFPEGGGETQWPFDIEDANAFDALIAAYGPMPADLAYSQQLDASRLAGLLDRIGPAIIVTHSASGPDGWLVADQRPELVAAIVAIEPMGPAFGHTPGIGTLTWGLTAAPMKFSPPHATPAGLKAAAPETRRIPSLAAMPVALVTGETSVFSTFAPSVADFLRQAGAQVDHLHMPSFVIHGNGHGMIYEKNSDQVLGVVLGWLTDHMSPCRGATYEAPSETCVAAHVRARQEESL